MCCVTTAVSGTEVSVLWRPSVFLSVFLYARRCCGGLLVSEWGLTSPSACYRPPRRVGHNKLVVVHPSVCPVPDRKSIMLKIGRKEARDTSDL